MKRTLVVLLLLAAPAFAGSWQITTSANQDTRATRELGALNKATCATVGLSANCTQTNARIAFCAQPGSSGAVPCTVNGVSSGTLVILGTVGEYLDKIVVNENDIRLKKSHANTDLNAWNVWLAGASQAQKDAVCVAAGLSAPCLP